jgi:hypothetical protein
MYSVGRTLATALLWTVALSLPVAASAQWMWKDDSGHTVISDQPPPTNIPQSRIMRTPSGRSMGEPAPAPASDAQDAGKPKTLADQDLEFKKRQKELADASKKQQEEAAKAQENQQRCAALRASLSTLQSGVRIARTDDQGQRYFVDDSQRQTETQKVQSDISGSCK